MIKFNNLSCEKITLTKEKIMGYISNDEQIAGVLKLFSGLSPNELSLKDQMELTIGPEPLYFQFFNEFILDYRPQINYYQLKFYQDENELGTSQIFYLTKLKDPIELTINEKLERAFRVREGVEVWVFNKVRSGPKCDNCFDQIKEEAIKADCETCFGTGYLNGYYPPLRTFGQFLFYTEQEFLTPVGRIKPNGASIVLCYEPRIERDDLIYDPKCKKFFSIITTRTPIIKRYIVYQLANIQEIEPFNVCYKLINKWG